MIADRQHGPANPKGRAAVSPSDRPAWETPCPQSPDGPHCEHWYDDVAPCCFCGDDGDHQHGDHHPSLDCAICSERIRDGRITYAQVYALAERRYRRLGRSF